MNDRYLFRGKDIKTGKWVQGAYATGDDVIYTWLPKGYNPDEASLHLYEIEPDTVGQCTGLRDKNGTLIFEGDIVSSNANAIPKKMVVWIDDGWGLKIRQPAEPDIAYWYITRLNLCNKESEIIGNIHDNHPGCMGEQWRAFCAATSPELLERTEESC